MGKQKTKYFYKCVRVHEDLHHRLRTYAIENCLSESKVMRTSISEYLNNVTGNTTKEMFQALRTVAVNQVNLSRHLVYIETVIRDNTAIIHSIRVFIESLHNLDEREKQIIIERFLTVPPKTLVTIARDLGISKQRVEQIKEGALDKLQMMLEI